MVSGCWAHGGGGPRPPSLPHVAGLCQGPRPGTCRTRFPRSTCAGRTPHPRNTLAQARLPSLLAAPMPGSAPRCPPRHPGLLEALSGVGGGWDPRPPSRSSRRPPVRPVYIWAPAVGGTERGADPGWGACYGENGQALCHRACDRGGDRWRRAAATRDVCLTAGAQEELFWDLLERPRGLRASPEAGGIPGSSRPSAPCASRPRTRPGPGTKIATAGRGQPPPHGGPSL